MPHLQGVARDQIVLFPPSLEEYISADNPVRFIDAFVDHLDLQGPGFTRVIPAETGRPSYAPDDLLKLYLYGYLNRVRSSRLLERETQRNVEVMWLLKKLTPDFKTIADFRALHSEAIKQVCREFTELCKALDIFGGELVAIDGSKFQAVNNGRPMRYYESSACRTCPLKSQCTRNKRNRRITRARYEDALDRMAQRVRDHPEIMQLRMQLAEHPFGGVLQNSWQVWLSTEG